MGGWAGIHGQVCFSVGDMPGLSSCVRNCYRISFQAYRSISKCVAAICDAVPSETFNTVDKFIGDIKVSRDLQRGVTVHTLHICRVSTPLIPCVFSACSPWERLGRGSELLLLLLCLFVRFDLSWPCSDLGRVGGLQQVILGTFSSQSEEVRSAASYALGR